MSTETIKRSDVGEQELKDAQAEPEAIEAVQDESASTEEEIVAETQPEATGEEISDEIPAEKPSNETENVETEKPEVKAEVDWKAETHKERYKRQRKNEEIGRKDDEINRLQKIIDSGQGQAAVPQGQPQKPKRPKLYDDGIDGDEDKLDAAMDQFDDRNYEFREHQRVQNEQINAGKAKVEEYNDRIASYSAKNPTYGKAWEEAGKPTLPSYVEEALMESKLGPEIEHRLFEDFENLSIVTKQSPVLALRKIFEIENSLSAPVATKGTQKPKRRTISDAPEPASQLRGSTAKDDGFAAKFPNASISRASA